jgi:glucan 1,3-beta-glucosidase
MNQLDTNNTNFGRKIRGVNLGGWLVLEKWMTPSLFSGLEAVDETTFCAELGGKAPEVLRRHWESFVTEDDFAWIAARGLNSVRIPVGHWIFGPPYPYHPKYGGNPHPFVEGGIEFLDLAFDWAEKHGLLVQLDLHAAPGCQNGFDNGGIKDVCEWHGNQEYIEASLDVLERLAERYRNRPALHAIEVLNEPRWDIPTGLLKNYTERAYHRIRKHCAPRDVAVVFHDGFRNAAKYKGFMRPPEFENVVLDIHRYQCFSDWEIRMDIYGHIQRAAIERKNEADEINAKPGLWTYVGEWSLGLDVSVVNLWHKGARNNHLESTDRLFRDAAYRAYGAAQLLSFERYQGWYFWSYKTETTPAWCFRECVNRGWLPDWFGVEE